MITTGSIQTAVALEFRHDSQRDRTVLHRREAGGLCHIGKPYWDKDVLGLQLVNPTAGIFSGDDLEVRVDVGDNARVALNSPSATRFHTMAAGGAKISQEFNVGEGAWLDYQPEWTIPQRNSEVDQVTRVNLAADASLAFLDLIAPGRVAHGERSEYRRYTTTFELAVGGSLVARERMDLFPEDGGWPLAVGGWENCFYAAMWLVNKDLNEATFSALEAELDSDSLHCGTSKLADGVQVIRILSSRSLTLRNAVRQIRAELTPQLPLLAHDFRKL